MSKSKSKSPFPALPGSLKTAAIAATFALGALGAGCADEYEEDGVTDGTAGDKADDVTGDGEDDAPLPLIDIPAEFEFGNIGAGDSYEAFEDGSACDINFYNQGGYFLMGQLFMDLPDLTPLSCAVAVNGEVVSKGSVFMRVAGSRTIGRLMLTIYPGEPALVGGLDAQTAQLFCDYDDQRIASVDVTLAVTLTEDHIREGYYEKALVVDTFEQ